MNYILHEKGESSKHEPNASIGANINIKLGVIFRETRYTILNNLI